MIYQTRCVRARVRLLVMLAGGVVSLGAIPEVPQAAEDAQATSGVVAATGNAAAGEEPTAASGTPLSELMLAIRANRCDQVAVLLKKGQDPDVRDAFGYTPLTVAAVEKRPACIKALLDKDANVNLASSGGWTPLIAASMAGASPEVLELLLKAGADINARNQWGCTSLYYAAGFGAVPTVDHLLKRGAAVDGTGGECMSAMRIAELKGFNGVIERLKKAGAKPTAPQAQGQREPVVPASADKKS